MRSGIRQPSRNVLRAEQAIRLARLVERAVAEERAACASIAESLAGPGRDPIAREIAYRIRARSSEPPAGGC